MEGCKLLAITNANESVGGIRIDRLPMDQEMIARERWKREQKTSQSR